MLAHPPLNVGSDLLLLEQRLQSHTGIDLARLCPNSVAHAVSLRMDRLGLFSIPEYCDFIEHSDQELKMLVEEVVVPETWFFREPETFEQIAQFATRWERERRGEDGLRILSLPCSTGEEPYSAVMALLDAGLSPELFQVTAADISSRALAQGKRGWYSDHSFRTPYQNFRGRYFRSIEGGSQIHERIRSKVLWRELRLQDAGLQALGGFDLILCRNLLLYLTDTERRSAVERLGAMLRPRGLLFLAAAEARHGQLAGLHCLRLGGTFAFQSPLRLEVAGCETRRPDR